MFGGLIRLLVKQARKPEGFFGRLFAKSMGSGHQQVAIWGLGSFRFHDGDRILDVGCGGGKNILNLFEMYPKSAVDGVDFSPDSVRVSRKLHAGRLGENCRIEEGNVMSLPFADSSYGGVTACETIYFWPDFIGGLKEVYRVLKPGGRALLIVESNDPVRGKIWTDHCAGMTIYTPDEQVEAMIAAGFREVEAKIKGDWAAVSGIK